MQKFQNITPPQLFPIKDLEPIYVDCFMINKGEYFKLHLLKLCFCFVFKTKLED